MNVSHAEAKEFYEDFSLAVGTRDWLSPNARHLELKRLIRALLAGRRGLKIADFGCGAGVMTDFLCRYGDVVGVDFSDAAIEAARCWTYRPTFRIGGVEALPDPRYDLITMFDVMEHIPASERAGLIQSLAGRLQPSGLLFCSTPYPAATRYHRDTGHPGLQIIDEEVEIADLIIEAQAAGLQLIDYAAYDIWRGSPEYQAMVFTPARQQGGEPALTPRHHSIAARLSRHPAAVIVWRLRLAARALMHADVGNAIWFATARRPDGDS